jgi:hypothetical protein
MDRAMSIKRKEVDFISIFDGKSGKLNETARKFGFVGLPPVDKANKSTPVDF